MVDEGEVRAPIRASRSLRRRARKSHWELDEAGGPVDRTATSQPWPANRSSASQENRFAPQTPQNRAVDPIDQDSR